MFDQLLLERGKLPLDRGAEVGRPGQVFALGTQPAVIGEALSGWSSRV